MDSKEIAFVIAARQALLDAIDHAGPQILEPIVSVDVTVPDAVMGDITGNLASRRARINGTESLRGGLVTIKADVPLSALTDYHTELKSLTQGAGTFTMEFSHYDPVPGDVQQRLAGEHRNSDWGRPDAEMKIGRPDFSIVLSHPRPTEPLSDNYRFVTVALDIHSD